MNQRSGFSLLELSVVLVIIALVAGGVMVGQDLVNQGRIRSVMNDLTKYESAYNTFISKYNNMPGDMPDATAYWGAGAACPSTAGATGTQTCNGTGDGWLADVTGAPAGSSREYFYAWKHLANAGLVSGVFTGMEAAATRQATPGVNVPESAFDGAGYTMMSIASDGSSGWWAGTSYAFLSFGKISTGWETATPVLTTADLRSMDVKLDDGKPSTGVLRNRRGGGACVTTDVQATAEYALTNLGEQCSFSYSLAGDPGLTL
ncbi:MAG: prepilin-type N-terminal cleavage/methylation domain-containing protein [Rickettsiales bacterium]|nr:prepilin-type N-terminal cleavage/methylation domain-containing protein [Rickettsiales bacterium]